MHIFSLAIALNQQLFNQVILLQVLILQPQCLYTHFVQHLIINQLDLLHLHPYQQPFLFCFLKAFHLFLFLLFLLQELIHALSLNNLHHISLKPSHSIKYILIWLLILQLFQLLQQNH